VHILAFIFNVQSERMRSFFLFATLFLFYICSFGQIQQLSYGFTFDTTNAELKVDLRLNGTDSGKTYIKLPSSFGNQKELYKAIQSIYIHNKHAAIHPTDDSTVRLITHQPNSKLHLSYILKQDWTGALQYPLNFRAIIQKQYINANGFALLITPDMDSSRTVRVQLDWSKMPKSWQISNSLHAQTRKHREQLTLNDFRNTFYTAGDFRITKHMVAGKPIFIAVRGKNWKFTDLELARQITTIIHKQRDFWKDHSESYYFVGLIPLESEGSYNGSALHQSFTLSVSPNFTLNTSLLRLLAHEYMHRWNGLKIYMRGHEQENAWFGEGFTDYYTYKLLYTSGLIDLQEYIATINKTISDYYLSPVRNEPKSLLGEKYWTTREYNDLPYRKGAVYAFYVDQFIKQHSNGKHTLDDVMFALLKEADAKRPITEALFLQLVKQFSGQDINTDHTSMIDNGALIPVLPESLGDSVKLETRQMGAFDIGFNLQESWKNRKIEGVKENSAAWNAGLRNGQTIVGYSIHHDNITIPSEITIDVDGVKKTIKYSPMSSRKFDVPQFFIDNNKLSQ